MSDEKAVIAPEDLFDLVATIGAMAYDNVERSKGLQQQAETTLSKVEEVYRQSRRELQVILKEVQAQYASAAVEAAAAVAKKAAADFSDKAKEAGTDLRTSVETAEQKLQAHGRHWRRMVGVGAVCLVAGVIGSPFLARSLPVGGQIQVAALVMKYDGADAGVEQLPIQVLGICRAPPAEGAKQVCRYYRSQ